MANKLSQDIDALLEHYLHLLDQYTSMRKELSTLQSSLHQHIARANFSADRGIRYGADLYDERMHASRFCAVAEASSTLPMFTISAAPRKSASQEEQDSGQHGNKKEAEVEEDTTIAKPNDPIRMFGILTPPALRRAASDAVKMVEILIPRIASTDAEMKQVEIQIRKARKRRVKAEALEAQVTLQGASATELVSGGS